MRTFNFGGLLSVAFLLVLHCTACDKEEVTAVSAETATVELRSDTTVYGMHRAGGLGRLGCFDLVYPIGISFPDGTTAEVDDFDALLAAVAAWLADNPDVTQRPTFVFPIDVTDADGEVINVPDQDSLHVLAHSCRGAFRSGHGGNRHGAREGRGGGCNSCYTIAFPVTLSFPDGTTAEATDQDQFRALTHDWKQSNPEVDERPAFVFPITVTLEDGSTQEVADAAALTALRESCRPQDE